MCFYLPNPCDSSDSFDGWTSSCVSALESALSGPSIRSVKVTLIPASAVVVHDHTSLTVDDLIEMADDSGYGLDCVSSVEVQDQKTDGAPSVSVQSPSSKLYSVSMAIGGMHCASCVSSVTKAAEGVDGLVKGSLSVDLVGGSATAKVVRREAVDQLKNEIEDSGFDCEVIKIKDEEKRSKKKAKEEQRKVNVRVEGMFCG
jgi:Cu+-exporting ATPase